MPSAFLIREDGSLVGLERQPVAAEADFQALLALHPDLIAGDQVDPEAPRRWLLVAREVGVPDADDAGSRWSLDHLFLDQDAIPTFVEVKRAQDTRARREVVAQMLDYAANGIAYWSIEQLRASYEAQCAAAGANPADRLASFLGPDRDPADFWQTVKTNLQAGRVRLLFVADELPTELRRIIEFLNKQMDPAEVLGIEMRHLEGGGVRAIVPQVHGRTEEAQQKKASAGPQGPEWNQERFLGALRERGDEAGVAVMKAVWDWTRRKGLREWWGRGRKDGSFCPTLDVGDTSFWPVYFKTGFRAANIEFAFQRITVEPFSKPGTRKALLDQLNTVPGVRLEADAVDRFPSIRLAVLNDPSALRAFLGVLDWAFDQVRDANRPNG